MPLGTQNYPCSISILKELEVQWKENVGHEFYKQNYLNDRAK